MNSTLPTSALRSTALTALASGLLACAALAGCSDASVTEGETVEAEDEHVAKKYVCDETCVVDVFKDFSKVSRPAYGEGPAREWVKAEVAKAKRAWGSRASLVTVAEDRTVDAKGREIVNLLVKLPGTYHLKNRKAVALQAHLDMVFAAKAAQPGQPLEPFFANGVDVVETEAKDAQGNLLLDDAGKPIPILHARDFATTLGADNGQGVAQMVRYIRQPSLVHPPLELVFTAAEEVGLIGALSYDKAALPLDAVALISLDGSSAKNVTDPRVLADTKLRILVGANGGIVSADEGKLPAQPLAANAKRLSLSLSGLKGGHSGNDIGFKRMNALKVLSALLVKVRETDAKVQIIDVAVGDYALRRGQNRIANAFNATIAVDGATDTQALAATLAAFFATYAAPFVDESPTVKLEVKDAPLAAAPEGALSPALTKELTDALGLAPQGIQLFDAAYPNSAKASSNLGYFGLPSSPDAKTALFGYLPRAYDIKDAREIDAKTRDLFARVITAGGLTVDGVNATTRSATEVQPWFVPQSSAIVRKTLGIESGKQPGTYLIDDTMVLAGGTEPGEFMRMFPALKDRAIGLGPVIVQAHTTNETMVVQSFKDSTAALQKILIAWGNDATLLR